MQRHVILRSLASVIGAVCLLGTPVLGQAPAPAAPPLTEQEYNPDGIELMMSYALNSFGHAEYAFKLMEAVPPDKFREYWLQHLAKKEDTAVTKAFKFFWEKIAERNPMYFNMLAMMKIAHQPDKFSNWVFSLDGVPSAEVGYSLYVRVYKEDFAQAVAVLNGIDPIKAKKWVETADTIKTNYERLEKVMKAASIDVDTECEKWFGEKMQDPVFRQQFLPRYERVMKSVLESPELQKRMADDPEFAAKVKASVSRTRQWLGLEPKPPEDPLKPLKEENGLLNFLNRLIRGRSLKDTLHSELYTPDGPGAARLSIGPAKDPSDIIRYAAARIFYWEDGMYPECKSSQMQQFLGELAKNAIENPLMTSFAQQQQALLNKHFPSDEGAARFARVDQEIKLSQAQQFTAETAVQVDSPARRVLGISVPLDAGRSFPGGLKGATLFLSMADADDSLFVEVTRNASGGAGSGMIDRQGGQVCAQLQSAHACLDDNGQPARDSGTTEGYARDYGRGPDPMAGPDADQSTDRVYLHLRTLPGTFVSGLQSGKLPKLTLRSTWLVQPAVQQYVQLVDPKGTAYYMTRFTSRLWTKIADVPDNARICIYRRKFGADGRPVGRGFVNLTGDGLKVEAAMEVTAAPSDADRAQVIPVADMTPPKDQLKIDYDRPLTFARGKDGFIEFRFLDKQSDQPASGGPYQYVVQIRSAWETPESRQQPEPKLEPSVQRPVAWQQPPTELIASLH